MSPSIMFWSGYFSGILSLLLILGTCSLPDTAKRDEKPGPPHA
jgi:hypothetical protein